MVASRLGLRFQAVCPSVCLGMALLHFSTLSGCKKPEEIRVYTVPHREQIELVLQRMLGAIIPNDKEAWFFKLQGGDEEVSKLEPAFRAFTKSVEIKAGKVKWTAPESWKETAGSEFRFTTYLIPNGKEEPFQLAVSRLDAPSGVDAAYLQANLTRWRGQLGLDAIEKDEVAKVTTPVKFHGGSAYMVNFVGLPAPKNSMSAPFAGPMKTNPHAETPEAATEPGGSDFQFTTPTGWGQGKASSMRKASLAVGTGVEAADISVFEFPANANDLLQNVNRWRDQVGLKEISAEELQKTAKKIDVGGATGEYVELVGEKQTILGVMAKKGESAWFFKLQGPTEVAVREKARFEEFVKSAKLP